MAVSVDSAADRAGLEKTLGLEYPVLADPGLSVTEAYGVREAGKDHPGPATFVLDSDRRVVYRHVGRTAADRPPLTEVVRAAGG